MKYRRLGKTDLKVSVIGVGTWQFGGEWGHDYTPAEVTGILDKAHEVGINLIDTAECYGDHLSESLIGEYIQNNRREDWVIATKFGHRFTERFTRDQEWSVDEVQQQLDASLMALRTDYIDLYQFHSGTDEVFNNDDLWTMLDKQVQAGKIRHLGTSLSGSLSTYHQVDSSTKVNSKAIQVVYNRLDRKPEEHIFASCERQDLGVLARVPLASGFLSGKFKPGTTFENTDKRHRDQQEKVDRKIAEIEEIRRNEVPESMDMAQWALAWCLKHHAVTAVIPGCKNPEQVVSNAAAAQWVSENHPQAWKETPVADIK